MEKILEDAPKGQNEQSIRYSKEYLEFVGHLEPIEKVEDKLRHCLDFMRSVLNKDKTPVFKDFWQAKQLALEFFKENFPSRSRSVFWKEYTELSNEIRRIKEILDEQSSFSEEQMNLAIEAMEKEWVDQGIPPAPLSTYSFVIKDNELNYRKIQQELQILNGQAERIVALRKELISTQMRIRLKNRLFDRLSKLGDHVFPRRKECTSQISALFSQDVNRFVKDHFNLDHPPFFSLKEEIKALQSFAKLISLNSPTFNEVRKILSQCWEQIKEREIAHKEARAKEQTESQKQMDVFFVKIKDLKDQCVAAKISLKEADRKVEEILKEIKELHFQHGEVQLLKTQLFAAKKPLEEREAEKRKQEKEEAELEQKRDNDRTSLFLQDLREVLDQSELLTLDVLVEKWEALVKEGKTLNVKGLEKAMFENRLATIADQIEEKKWRALLSLGGEDLSSSLQVLLAGRQEERQKIRKALEDHRRIVGGSGLNFEQSLQYQELMSEEKMRLEVMETMIEEIEAKLFDLPEEE